MVEKCQHQYIVIKISEKKKLENKYTWSVEDIFSSDSDWQKTFEEIDKKIEEFSHQTNSPILSIPGISHFSGTSILSELGDIDNFTNHRQIIKYAGVAPLTYESSQFKAQHTKISKKGSKYFRKTLYQIILSVIQQNKVFKA